MPKRSRRAVLARTLLREQGAAVNPQDTDDVADVMMQENGVVEPETMEPQGETDQPQPGMLRVYDRQGRKTRSVINPENHPKPMVYSRRRMEKAVNAADQALIEELAEAVHNMWMGWAVHAMESVDAKTRRRWKPMMQPYRDLPEAEKQKDRVEAIALLDIVRDEGLQKSRAVLRKSTPGEHWITIHPHGTGANAAGDYVKGHHVLIDGDGRIVGGSIPKSAQGKHITNWWKTDQKQDEPGLSRHLREQGRAHTLTPRHTFVLDANRHPVARDSHEITLGEGHQTEEVRNRTRRGTHPETMPGHLRVRGAAQGRYWLDSAFADKDFLKQAGARWDGDARSWYAPNKDVLHQILADDRHFPHVTIDHNAVYAYDTGETAASAPRSPAQTLDSREAQALPPLEGTPKQVAWADELRAKHLKMIREAAHDILDRRERAGLSAEQSAAAREVLQLAQQWLDRAEQETSAKWWIDHRNKSVGDYLYEVRDYIRQHRTEIAKSRHNAHGRRGVFVRKGSQDHREAETARWQKKTRGMNPNPPVLRKKRPRPGMLPKEAGNPLGSPMQESSMQVLGAITQSKRRSPQPDADWGFDPLANLPGTTAQKKPIGTPNVFMYKSDPQIRAALHDYAALLDAGKSAPVATHLLSQRYPWVQAFDTPRGRDWWAAVRRADLAMPRAFEGLDTEVDPDDENGPRPKRAVFWKETPANLGQGIMAPTGSGGAGR